MSFEEADFQSSEFALLDEVAIIVYRRCLFSVRH